MLLGSNSLFLSGGDVRGGFGATAGRDRPTAQVLPRISIYRPDDRTSSRKWSGTQPTAFTSVIWDALAANLR